MALGEEGVDGVAVVAARAEPALGLGFGGEHGVERRIDGGGDGPFRLGVGERRTGGEAAASSAAAVGSSAASTTRDTRPHSAACSAVNGSPRRISSLARAAPTARTSVADSPESHVSPIAVNAVASRAPAAAMRRSHARAMPSPAPTQVPLIAASTGFGIVASAVTIGA